MLRVWKILALAPAVALLGSCAYIPWSGPPTRWIDPSQAVQLAAAAPRLGVAGVFALKVRATHCAGRLFIDSERDYRDPRNLVVVVSPAAVDELKERWGVPPERALRGRWIQVAGTARRVRIDLIVNGRPSGKYYYQTHVDVARASQIQWL